MLRLDGRYFGDAGSGHVPMVGIGGVALPVPYSRDVQLSPIARSAAARGARIRAALALPKDVAGWPRSALRLNVIVDAGDAVTQPDRMPTSTFGLVATRLERGWRLRAHPHDRARGKIVADVPTAHDGRSSLVQLRATAPMPPTATSRAFDVPFGATLTLRYGIAHRSDMATAVSACFRATLACAWRPRRELVSECVRSGDPGVAHWHRVDASLRWGGRDCRLTLVTKGADAGDAVWAVPRVRAPARDDPIGQPNVVLVSLDTLRADHLGSHGYPRPTSPELDDLVIRRGTVFTEAVSTYPMTHVAHLGIFTGLYPAALPANGVLGAGPGIAMLTECLRDAGFTTIGVTEDALVSKDYGFGSGFDHLVELHPGWADRARLVFARGRRILHAVRDRRFFLFLHNYKVHAPYLPSPAYAELFAGSEHDRAMPSNVPPEFARQRDDYDRSIRELDDEVGAFVRALDAEGLADRTLLVVLSDHGEAFGEHGIGGHGFSAGQEALHVLLAFRGPGVTAQRIATPVSLVDVAPTILDLVGLPVPSSMQGRSLRPALAGDTLASRPVFFEWNGQHTGGVRFGTMKLVRSGSSTVVYDLALDPGEARPVRGGAVSFPGLTRALRSYDREGARRRATLEAPSEAPSVSPDVEESLRALGYVQ